MDSFTRQVPIFQSPQQPNLIRKLRIARQKLGPIVNSILSETIRENEESKYFLTQKQYEDIINAAHLMNQTNLTYELKANTPNYNLPNCDITVANVCSGKCAKEPPIVIQENIIRDLIQLYEDMGKAIRRIVCNCDEAVCCGGEGKEASCLRSILNTQSSTRLEEDDDFDEFLSNVPAHSSKMQNASSKYDTAKSVNSSSKYDTAKTLNASSKYDTARTDSTQFYESAIDRSNQGGAPDRSDTYHDATTKLLSTRESEKCDGNCVFIKMQCFNSPSSSEMENTEPTDAISTPCSTCKTHSTPHFHVKVGGKPILLKVDQDRVENGMVYCINTESEDKLTNDIKIVIRKCTECQSTVIGSTTNMMESHESITLHGKYPETEEYEDDEDDTKKGSKLTMDVFLDAEDVTKSKIVVSPSDEEKNKSRKSLVASRTSFKASFKDETTFQRSSKVIAPLMRGRVCSSMEFDVSKEKTRLRTNEIEHKNPTVVVELKNLGVDQILRACRPAKCCRKAILDERQQVALPYTVSLKSLPLLGNDVDVIKQSIDMSVRKIKNSTNLSEELTNKMAYYVNLGMDDFRPNLNFPWVVPVYDVECTDLDNEEFENEKKENKQKREKVNEKKCNKQKITNDSVGCCQKFRKPRRKKKNIKPKVEKVKVSEDLIKTLIENGKAGEGNRTADLLQANILTKSKSLNVLRRMRKSNGGFLILRKLDHDRNHKQRKTSISIFNPEFKKQRFPNLFHNLSKEGIRYLLTLGESKSKCVRSCRFVEKRRFSIKRKRLQKLKCGAMLSKGDLAESTQPNSVSSFEKILDDCLEKIRQAGYKIDINNLRRIQSDSLMSFNDRKDLNFTKSYSIFEKDCLKMNLCKHNRFYDYKYYLDLEENKYNWQCPTRPVKFETMFFSRKKKARQTSHSSTNTNSSQINNRYVMTETIINEETQTQTTAPILSNEPNPNTQAAKKHNLKNQATQSFHERTSELMRIVNDYQGHFAPIPNLTSRSTVISELTSQDMQYLNAIRKIRHEDFLKLYKPIEEDLTKASWSPFIASTTSLPYLMAKVEPIVDETVAQKKEIEPLKTKPNETNDSTFHSINDKSKTNDTFHSLNEKSSSASSSKSKSKQNDTTNKNSKSKTMNDTAADTISKTLNETPKSSKSKGNKSQVDSFATPKQNTMSKTNSKSKGGDKTMADSFSGIEKAPQSTPKSSRESSLNERSTCSSKCDKRCDLSRRSRNSTGRSKSSSKGNSSKSSSPASKFIQIQIEKKGNQIKSVEAKALNPCTKDICELYKNEQMMCNRKSKTPNHQKMNLSSDENIEIFVDNKRLSIINPKKKQ